MYHSNRYRSIEAGVVVRTGEYTTHSGPFFYVNLALNHCSFIVVSKLERVVFCLQNIDSVYT